MSLIRSLIGSGSSSASLDGMGFRSTGSETMPRWAATATSLITLSSQVLRLGYYTALRSETVTQASVSTGSTAAAATPSLVRYGLFSVAANGDLTLIASTANDTTLLAATGTAYPKSFSTPVAVTAGNKYALGALVVTATTAPIVVGAVGGTSQDMGAVWKLAGVVTAQSDLASTYTAGSVTNSSNMIYASVRP